MSASRPLTSAWLEERLDLFGRFCLPSVSAQTTENFVWTLFCDEATDDDVIARLREHAAELPNIRVVETGADRDHNSAIADLFDPTADVLITTRLDSDDAIADDHLASIQAYAESFHRSTHWDLLVNFPHGYRLDTRSGELFEDWMPFSSFHSLLERPKAYAAKTVMHSGHARLHYEHPTQQDESLSRWLIVVHGDNLVNRIRDDLPPVRRTSPGVPGFSLAYP